MKDPSTQRAPRNRTLTLTPAERKLYSSKLKTLKARTPLKRILNSTICQDSQEACEFLPSGFADLVFLDPPYNISKIFNSRVFRRMDSSAYALWMDSWLSKMVRLMKPTASVYICADWRSSGVLYDVARKYFILRNRITWEREKGRGAKSNWKNCAEDIWFCTVSDRYTFNVDAVKIRRKVIAPYTFRNGAPKDWERTRGGNFRITHPSNIWTDLTVPFWSMPENTDHPTQKPEKLIAKIILASTRHNDVVFDPFLGSGTASVVAKKLHRRYVGIEIDEEFACLAEKRLALAANDSSIQGFANGVFWERNTPGGATKLIL